ncbi:Uncharacterised protein [Candidatus Burarchaeum australiense]|nr:Uncharacterised protein [Candidatus Burarchaeum australiense]
MQSLSEALLELADYVEEKDVHGLRKLSNKCLEKVSIDQHAAFLKPAMLAYAFAKVISKAHYWKDRSQAVFVNSALAKLSKAAKLADTDEPAALVLLDEIAEALKGLDVKDGRFVRDIMQKAALKMASTLYAQGFSLDSAVAVTGADKRELVKYIGKTLMFDRTGSAKTMEERLKSLRSILS